MERNWGRWVRCEVVDPKDQPWYSKPNAEEIVLRKTERGRNRRAKNRAQSDENSLAPSRQTATVALRESDESKDGSMAIGTVKWFNTDKGYGFIQPDDGGKDVFVHVSAIEAAGFKAINEGQKIEYDIETDKRTKKTCAGNLRAV